MTKISKNVPVSARFGAIWEVGFDGRQHRWLYLVPCVSLKLEKELKTLEWNIFQCYKLLFSFYRKVII